MTNDPVRRPARAIGAALVALIALAALAPAAEARGVTVAGRPLHLHVPPNYTGSSPVPLVILLHGVGVTSALQEVYMRVAEQADLHGFIYAYPDGLIGPGGQFWNGANCCQDAYTPAVDDVAYLDAIINYVRDHYNLDQTRVYIIGHSNGAYMASRFACESSRVRAIVTIGGGQYAVPTTCGWRWPTQFEWYLPWLPIPVPATASVLHIHGTNDEITPYNWSWTMLGPFGGNTLPSAPMTIASWMVRNGCSLPAARADLPPLDLDINVPGAETTRAVSSWCAGPALEFWTMNGSRHAPRFFQSPPTMTIGARAVDWLLAH